MAVFCEIKMPGFSYSLGRARIEYTITGTLDPNVARDALIAAAPATANSVINASYDVTERAYGIWDGVVEYGVPEEQTRPDQEDGKTYKSFTTIGGTAHITQSIATVASYCLPCQESQPQLWEWYEPGGVGTGGWTWGNPTGGVTQSGCQQVPPANDPVPNDATAFRHGTVTEMASPPPGYIPSVAPNFGGAIGVTKDSIEGADIVVPEFKFQGKAYLNDSVVDDAFVATLTAATGKVFSGTWKMFAEGEVLFLGATGSREGRSNWEVTFEFAASPNVTGLQIGEIDGITKKGWEYLWVRYYEHEDEDAHVLVRKPISVYIEQVYHYVSPAFLTGIF